VNPMIGTRGVRLGVVKPGLYEMQVRALFRAVATVTAIGISPNIEVMIPLVVAPSEMAMARTWVTTAVAEVASEGARVSVGAMLETPRAALVAGELAEVSDFFSFGTNDLTQLMFAFSRDDVGSKLIPEYLRHGLLDADPFEVLDQIGVGRIIRHACEHARTTKADIKIGVCGEQAGDPESAKFLVACGVDYVSCSPYRVPIARLAVAQALLETGRVSDAVLEAIVRHTAPTLTEETQAETPAHVPEALIHAPQHGSDEFLVLHALRIKGFAAASLLAEIAVLPVATVETNLHAQAEHGRCRHMPARDLWQLTPEGREHHATLMADVMGESTERLREHYDFFLTMNDEFKSLCAAWQTKNGDANDHTDAAYDAERIAALRDLHVRSAAALIRFADAVPRFESYERRLAAALTRVEGGETRMFTGVMCGSYHDVWMELHEDLVQLLGVDRHAEGSY